jgi:hypothetical protein
MKDTNPKNCLSHQRLRFIRDANPTEIELLTMIAGPSEQGKIHVLRKAGLIELHEGCVRLSSAHLSRDGKFFYVDDHIYSIEEDLIRIVCRGA